MARRHAAIAVLVSLSATLGCATPSSDVAEPEPVVAAAARPPEAERAPAATSPVAVVEATVRLDEHRALGGSLEVGNLTVWPVFTDAPQDPGELAGLPAAQKRREADVRECGCDDPGLSFNQRFREGVAVGASRAGARGSSSGGPEVNRLVIDNGGAAPLLVLAGTLLRGGDQDRILAEDLVVPPDTAVLAGVYCVEPGRWSGERAGAPTAGRFTAVDCVAVTEIRRAGQYERSQRGVWNQVAAVNETASRTVAARTANGPADEIPRPESTSFFVSVDGAPEAVTRTRNETVASVLRHFEELRSRGRDAVGFAYAVDGRPVAVRTFAGPRIFETHLGALVCAMAMDAQTAARSARRKERAATAQDVVALVRSIQESGSRTIENRGTHRLVYSRAAQGWGCALQMSVNGHDVTLTEDWTAR